MYEALKEKDVVMSELQSQLAATEEECRQSAELVREKSAALQAQQAEIKQLRDQLVVPQKVS